MKKFTILLLLFILIVIWQIPASGAVNSSFIPIATQYDDKASNLTDSDLFNLAQTYQSISDRMANFSPSQIGRLHEYNPNISVVRYLNFSCRFGDQQEMILRDHPDWVLRDASGNPVPAIWGAGNGITLDPANPEWRNYLIDQSYKAVTEGGYDGIMADVILMVNKLPSDFKGINPRTGQIYTTAQWRDDQYETLRLVKEKIGKDKRLVANNVRFGKGYFEEGASRFLNVVDGVVAEDFRGPSSRALDSSVSEDVWKMNVDMLIDIQSKGKSAVANVKYNEAVITDQNKKAESDRFLLATFLLGKGELSYYSSEILLSNRQVKREYDPVWKTAIGIPLNIYYKKDGVYMRDFSNGKVLVNPTKFSYTVDLGGEYKTFDAMIVRKVTIAAQQGLILTK